VRLRTLAIRWALRRSQRRLADVERRIVFARSAALREMLHDEHERYARYVRNLRRLERRRA
jgi:hypothetical protein